MRVATWNVRHGRPRRGFTSNRTLAATARQLDVDVFAAQEVERRVVRSWFADQLKRLARATGSDRSVFAPARRLALVGHDGVALCVRGAIVEHRVVTLPRTRREQRRVAIVARVEVRGVESTVVTTHLHNDAGVARRQLEALLDVIASEPPPRVLLGDLNLRPEDVGQRLRVAGFSVADGGPSEPAWTPVQRIDHVAVDGFVIERVDVPPVAISDHRPVLAWLARP